MPYQQPLYQQQPPPQQYVYEKEWFFLTAHEDGHLDHCEPDPIVGSTEANGDVDVHVHPFRKCKTMLPLSLMLVALEIFIIYMAMDVGWWLILLMVFIFFFIRGAINSKLIHDLSSLGGRASDLNGLLERVRGEAVHCEWRLECYHMKRVKSGKSHSYKRVVTKTATKEVFFPETRDLSGGICGISNCRVLFVDFTINVGIANAHIAHWLEGERTAFINANISDAKQTFTIDNHTPSFTKHKTFTPDGHLPWFLSKMVFLFFTFFGLESLLLLWLEFNSAKVDYHFLKVAPYAHL